DRPGPRGDARTHGPLPVAEGDGRRLDGGGDAEIGVPAEHETEGFEDPDTPLCRTLHELPGEQGPIGGEMTAQRPESGAQAIPSLGERPGARYWYRVQYVLN